jgi:hypothetical protein
MSSLVVSDWAQGVVEAPATRHIVAGDRPTTAPAAVL